MFDGSGDGLMLDPGRLEELFFEACDEWDNDDTRQTGGGFHSVYANREMGTVDGHFDESFWKLLMDKVNDG